MLLKRIAITASALACLLTAGTASAQEFQIQVGPSFTESPIRFTGGMPDPYIVNWDIIEYQGQLALCGIGYLRDSRLNATIRGMARDGSLEVDGQVRPINLNFFTRARSTRDLRSGTATCRTVGPLPVTNATIYLDYGNGTFRN